MCLVKRRGPRCLGGGTEDRAGKVGGGGERLQGWGGPVPQSAGINKHSHLLRYSPGTLEELLLGVGIAGAALQSTCFGDQSSTAMAQLLYPVLDVGAYL